MDIFEIKKSGGGHEDFWSCVPRPCALAVHAMEWQWFERLSAPVAFIVGGVGGVFVDHGGSVSQWLVTLVAEAADLCDEFVDRPNDAHSHLQLDRLVFLEDA